MARTDIWYLLSLHRRKVGVIIALCGCITMLSGQYKGRQNINYDAFVIVIVDVLTAFILAREHSCLLYTSPSPRDRTRSRMPSSA